MRVFTGIYSYSWDHDVAVNESKMRVGQDRARLSGKGWLKVNPTLDWSLTGITTYFSFWWHLLHKKLLVHIEVKYVGFRADLTFLRHAAYQRHLWHPTTTIYLVQVQNVNFELKWTWLKKQVNKSLLCEDTSKHRQVHHYLRIIDKLKQDQTLFNDMWLLNGQINTVQKNYILCRAEVQQVERKAERN